MTLDEKVAQLSVWESKAKLQTARGRLRASSPPEFPERDRRLRRPSDYRGVSQSNGAAGAAGGRSTATPRQTAEYVNAAQHWAVEHTRLGIPILMHEELAARRRCARRDQLSAGDRAGEHMGS